MIWALIAGVLASLAAFVFGTKHQAKADAKAIEADRLQVAEEMRRLRIDAQRVRERDAEDIAKKAADIQAESQAKLSRPPRTQDIETLKKEAEEEWKSWRSRGGGVHVRLIDLFPQWASSGGAGVSRVDPVTGEQVPVPERHGIGVIFDCPCGCDNPCFIPFRNPLDGGPQEGGYGGQAAWQRECENFYNMTLTPSILRSKEKGGCGWHGFITHGEVITC